MNEHQQSTGAAGEVTHNEAQTRYELRMDGRVAAMAQYSLEGGKVRFTHTEVESEHEGQGLGSRLAAGALDDVRQRGLKAVPQCRFIAAYIARHEQEYGDLVDRT